MTTSVHSLSSYMVDSIAATPGLTPNGLNSAHTFTASQITTTAPSSPAVRKDFAVVVGVDELDPTRLSIKRVDSDYQTGETDDSIAQFEVTGWYQTSDPMPFPWSFPIDIANRWFPPQ
jgi:hypothetical protein